MSLPWKNSWQNMVSQVTCATKQLEKLVFRHTIARTGTAERMTPETNSAHICSPLHLFLMTGIRENAWRHFHQQQMKRASTSYRPYGIPLRMDNTGSPLGKWIASLTLKKKYIYTTSQRRNATSQGAIYWQPNTCKSWCCWSFERKHPSTGTNLYLQFDDAKCRSNSRPRQEKNWPAHVSSFLCRKLPPTS